MDVTQAVDRDASVGAVVLTGTDGRFLTHADPKPWLDGSSVDQPIANVSHLGVQADGNLVQVDAGGNVVWHTNSYNRGVTKAVLRDDCNLVLLNPSNTVLWSAF